MRNVNVVTSLPDVEKTRIKNMRHYSIMMGVRLACIFVCFLVPLTWMWVPALLAVFIPMIATVSTTQQKAQAESILLVNAGRELV